MLAPQHYSAVVSSVPDGLTGDRLWQYSVARVPLRRDAYPRIGMALTREKAWACALAELRVMLRLDRVAPRG